MTSHDEFTGNPVIARIASLGQRLRRLDAAHRWILDLGGVVAVILLFCVPDVVRPPAPERLPVFAAVSVPVRLVLQAGLVLPLLWRRRFPMITFYVIATVFVVQWSLSVILRADVALLIAVYNLVLHGRPRWLPWGGSTAIAAMVVVAVRLSTAISFWDALFLALSTITAAAALGIAVRLRRAQMETLRERAAQLEVEHDQRSKLAAATERTRIAREMHDVVGHNLSVIVTLADGGAYASTAQPQRGKEALELISETGRRALNDLRRVLGVLRQLGDTAEWAPQPDIAAIGPLCDQIRAAGPHVSYRTRGDIDCIDPGLQLTAYRIVQEAFTNSLRYAGPQTRIGLEISVDETRLRITMHDTGPAAADYVPPPAPRPGHGLLGIRERTAIYNGTATAGPDPRGGWTLTATLSLARPPITEGA